MKENPASNFFLDEAFGISSELIGDLVNSLQGSNYFWIAFQHKKCPNEDDLNGISFSFFYTFTPTTMKDFFWGLFRA